MTNAAIFPTCDRHCTGLFPPSVNVMNFSLGDGGDWFTFFLCCFTNSLCCLRWVSKNFVWSEMFSACCQVGFSFKQQALC